MDYSVIIPVFNSEESLEELFQRTMATFKSFADKPTFELIFVDDFSKDKSWKILKKLKDQFPNLVKIIRFSKNFGQHNATFCGLKHASGDYLITIDDDLQFAPEDISKLVKKISSEELDLVYGIPKSSTTSLKNAGSIVWKKGSKFMEGSLGEGSSFRIFNSVLLQNVLQHDQHFIFLDELLFWYTECIGFVSIEKNIRKHGKTSYSWFTTLKFVTSITFVYGTWPLKLMTYGGAIFSFLSFLIGVFFIVKKYFLGGTVMGFTAIIVAISFSTSLILLCFGIIGNYLNNIYVVLNNKPNYSIKESKL